MYMCMYIRIYFSKLRLKVHLSRNCVLFSRVKSARYLRNKQKKNFVPRVQLKPKHIFQIKFSRGWAFSTEPASQFSTILITGNGKWTNFQLTNRRDICRKIKFARHGLNTLFITRYLAEFHRLRPCLSRSNITRLKFQYFILKNNPYN